MVLQKIIIAFLVITVLVVLGSSNCEAANAPQVKKELHEVKKELHATVKEVFDSRARAMITDADPGPALAYYNTSAKLGSWALSHEQAKLDYIQLWAKNRGVHFTEAKSTQDIPWLQVMGDTAEFVVYQTLQLGYVYPDDPVVNRFGIGTRHWMEMVRKDGKWLIQRDFYTDGLGDDSLAPNPKPAEGTAMIEPVENASSLEKDSPDAFDREGATRYADEYAGLAWGAGNNHSYNPGYCDFNDKGGDCANYVSQCLADAKGGKLPMDGAWYYRHDREGGSGSQAWVRAEAFGDWLLYSWRGQRIARGTFPELNQPDAKFPRGAMRELRKGDVIGFGEKSFSGHLSIVVGSDSKGYPLVNAHNVDRYHCPWDMGYDKMTVFHLYRINGR